MPSLPAIERGAMLCDASGSPESLLCYLAEIKAKGYAAITFFPISGNEVILKPLCEEAARIGLAVWVITGYMKYQEDYLLEHPDQRIVLAADVFDQDALSMATWACPFQPEFKERYLKFLRLLCELPAVTRIALNDEAALNYGCYCHHCRKEYARELGGEMPPKIHLKAEDWNDPVWRRFLQWRMARWNKVHAEMAEAVHQANPGVKAVFLASPAMEFWSNPWQTGVDLSSMIRVIDGITVDPYYTFHPRHFDPAEAYLSEWCRFLAGIVPEGKEAEIAPQGFSHPTFTRPLGEADGYWTALVPAACGIRKITPYCYPYQKGTPVQKTYESCFRIDPYFARSAPLKYAAIVHGVQSEIFAHPLPAEVPHSYDGTRVMPVAEALRHRGIPYAYISDRDLDVPSKLDGYRVVILPEIACLSKQQGEAVLDYVENGGNLVILGDFGSLDETGGARDCPLLLDAFGIRIERGGGEPQMIALDCAHPSLKDRESFDEAGAARYRGGAARPVLVLKQCVRADIPADAEVIATCRGADGSENGGAAIATFAKGRGRVVWFGGFPSRNATDPKFGLNVLNQTQGILASVVKWAAGADPVLRVNGWPPEVPIRKLRPFDQRNYSTFEFFPMAGDDQFMGLVTSYFREPAEFTITLSIPPGKQLLEVTELIAETPVAFQQSGFEATIPVVIDAHTAALVYLFQLSSLTD